MFKEKKYEVIKNAISYELANFVYNYLLLRRDASKFIYEKNISVEGMHYGTWKDPQVPDVYSEYSDMVMETLMMKCLPVLEEKTGFSLVPNYSYTRVYEKGSILKRHKDRKSCEISTTLNLGGDEWPIFIDPTGTNNVIDEYKNIHKPNAPSGDRIVLEPGDMLIYSGCELEHWREEFEGDICGQVFLHYNSIKEEHNTNVFDGRPILGIKHWMIE